MNKFVGLIIFVLIGILISGYFPLGNTPVWPSQYIALTFFLFLGIGFVLWDFNKFLSIFVGVCIASTFFVTKMGIHSMMYLTQFSMLCLASYGVSRLNKNHRKWIIGAIGGIVLMQAGWLIVQYFNVDPMFYSLADSSMDKMVGFSGSQDQIGSFFAITTPIMLYIHPLLGIISLIGVCISKSSFAFIATIISGLMYFFFMSKKIFLISLVVFIIAGLVFFGKVERLKGADFGTRGAVWLHSIKATAQGSIVAVRNNRQFKIKTNPWLGFGLGNYQQIFPYVPQQKQGGYLFNYVDEKFTHAHNDYVETFFDLGYIGISSLFLLIGGFIYEFFKSKRTRELTLFAACVVSYLLCASGNFCSQIAVSGLLLTLCYGCYKGALNGKT